MNNVNKTVLREKRFVLQIFSSYVLGAIISNPALVVGGKHRATRTARYTCTGVDIARPAMAWS